MYEASANRLAPFYSIALVLLALVALIYVAAALPIESLGELRLSSLSWWLVPTATFFPFYLLQTNADFDIDCFDADPTAGQALREAANILGISPGFHLENLEDLQQEDNSVDAVYSISVIEHTGNPCKVIDEIFRVLKSDGLFICTFDVSFETRSPMHVRHIGGLVAHIENLFKPSSDWHDVQFTGLPADDKIVTTRWIAETAALTLPWRNPLLVWMYDMLRGRPRSTLYRPMTYCCGSFSKRLP